MYTISLLNSQECVLDCRTIEFEEGMDEDKVIKDAVLDLVYNSVLSPGDKITIYQD